MPKTQKTQQATPDLITKIIKDKVVRTQVTTKSHFWFFHVYFNDYVEYETADFQREMFALTEDEAIKNLVIVAFRGSGKTTIFNQSYPLWSILGTQQKKFVLILAETMVQARQMLRNIKEVLETNELLRADLGPFTEEETRNSSTIYLLKYKAKIMVASRETSIRGIKHGAHRPDLIILDDIEDINSVKTKDSRDSTYTWLTGDVMPLGSKNTRLVFIGNLLHEDSLLMRLKNGIEEGRLLGQYRMYPLVQDDQILWPGMYPTLADVEHLRLSLGNEIAFQREYMLKIIPDEDWVVQPEWIQYYDTLPEIKYNDYTCIGIDLAISEKETADYTAMVPALVTGRRDDLKVFILPMIINKRLTFLQAQDEAKALSINIGSGKRAKLFVEDVAYQRAFVQAIQAAGFPVKGVQVYGQDKRARLNTNVYIMQANKVFFPRKGAELLIQQLLHFGVEKHDDLADAFGILLSKIIEEDNKGGGGIAVRGGYTDRDDWNTLNSRQKLMVEEQARQWTALRANF